MGFDVLCFFYATLWKVIGLLAEISFFFLKNFEIDLQRNGTNGQIGGSFMSLHFLLVAFYLRPSTAFGSGILTYLFLIFFIFSKNKCAILR